MVELEGREGEVVERKKYFSKREEVISREGFKFQVFTTLRIRIFVSFRKQRCDLGRSFRRYRDEIWKGKGKLLEF